MKFYCELSGVEMEERKLLVFYIIYVVSYMVNVLLIKDWNVEVLLGGFNDCFCVLIYIYEFLIVGYLLFLIWWWKMW